MGKPVPGQDCRPEIPSFKSGAPDRAPLKKATRQAWLFRLLASRTNPEELQFVRDGFEIILPRNTLLDFSHAAFLDLDNFRATRADQMMMVAVVSFPQ